MAQFQFRKFELLPVVIKNLIIINVLVWIAQITLGRSFPITDLFALHDVRSELFRPHQIITHMFMHDPSGPGHLLFNMLALWMFGSALENVWGAKRFLIFYVASGLGAAALHLAVLWFQNSELINAANSGMLGQQLRSIGFDEGVGEYVRLKLNEPTLGASGAVFGCLAGFGYLFPNTYIYLYFFIPVKAKWFVLGYAALELYSGVAATAGDNVAHFAHLGGAIVGFLLVYYWNKSNRRNFY
ncbi:MAG: rhomboid family intramembrane serine protease [Chitinophagaceae bacterium]|nr:rhomboid family intramembrane serine protease [Chitinophagaceae bacterium]